MFLKICLGEIDLRIWNSKWDEREWKELPFVLHQFDGRNEVEIEVQKEIERKMVYSQSQSVASSRTTRIPIAFTIRKCEGQCEETHRPGTNDEALRATFLADVCGTYKLELPMNQNIHV